MPVGLLQFKRIHNFRDMGGLPTNDGRIVRRGMLFRSGELANATSEDVKKLKELNLKVILDYRDDFEAENSVSPTLPNVKTIRHYKTDERTSERLLFNLNIIEKAFLPRGNLYI